MQTWLSLSNDLASAVERAGRSVVAAPARGCSPRGRRCALPRHRGDRRADASGRVIGINAMIAGGLALGVSSHVGQAFVMAEGLRNRAIAQRVGISTHTVKFHIAAILDKLNARSRTEAVTSARSRQ